MNRRSLAMRARPLVPLALLACAVTFAVTPAPGRAVNCDDSNQALDLLGTSPSGDAFALREVILGEGDGDACSYPSVKGRCTEGVSLHVCRTGGPCKEFAIYAPVSTDPESGKVSSRTPQAEAERNLAAAKRAMAEAKIVQAEGTLLAPARPDDPPAADLKEFADLGPVTFEFGSLGSERKSAPPEVSAGPGDFVARLSDGTAILLGVSGSQGDAGWISGDAAVFVSKDRAHLVFTFYNECGSRELQPSLVPIRTLAARLLNARGYRRYRAGDVAGAVKDLSRAVEADPDLVMARCNLGLALVKAGRAEEGVAALAEALRRGDAGGKATTSCR